MNKKDKTRTDRPAVSRPLFIEELGTVVVGYYREAPHPSTRAEYEEGGGQ